MSRRGELLGAYLATTYVVRLPDGSIPIRVGERQPALDALLIEQEAGAWAFVTAHNPGSIPEDAPANQKRQRALEAELAARGFSCLAGESRGDDGAWPPEASVLVLGISIEEAVALARRHGQAAIVFGVYGGVAELVWCDD